MSGRPPAFTVVLSTFGRGRHIEPTVESVLRQGFNDFELLIVGDGCDDETPSIAQSYGPKVRWHNLDRNSGSQSAPNNYGIAAASGEWIAYIGHDDVWHSTHLLRLAELRRANEGIDVAVSGCIFHGPPDSGVAYVTGLFEDEDAKYTHFFPPSSIAHRRELSAQIGPWRDPDSIPAPVDADFFLRAAAAGMNFLSTGRITAHKFAAGHRYLSYLQPQSNEQRAFIQDPHSGDAVRLFRAIKEARDANRFMAMRHIDFSGQRPGELFHRNRSSKGLRRPPLKPLAGPATIHQTEESRGLDWHALEAGSPPYRWSGPNPRPKILIPYTHDGEAEITFRVAGAGATPLGSVEIFVNGEAADRKYGQDDDGLFLRIEARLLAADYSVITLGTPIMLSPPKPDIRSVGIPISDINVIPLPERKASPPRAVVPYLRRLFRQGR